RALLHRDEWRTGHAIQDEHAPHLRGDGDGGRAVAPREERRLGRDVLVPEIVVGDLDPPDELAGGRAQGDDGIGPPVVALSNAAEVVGAGAAGGGEDQTALWIDGHGRPGVARAGARSGLARPGDRVPGPAERARTTVEGAHDSPLD